MNKNLNHKGASKRKGAAESEELTEKGPVDGMDEGMAKKKGAAQESLESIIKHGQNLQKQKAKANTKSRNENFNAGVLDSINLENTDQGTKAKEIYGENYGQSKNNKYIGSRDSAVQVSPEVLKSYQDFKIPGGANRMGFTQNFGAARENGYAKGAAKVASIMNFGAAKYGGNKGDESESNRDYEK